MINEVIEAQSPNNTCNYNRDSEISLFLWKKQRRGELPSRDIQVAHNNLTPGKHSLQSFELPIYYLVFPWFSPFVICHILWGEL